MAISVVIPAFNEESSLARCVRAVLAQSGGAVVEVIVVDNGSRDDTHAVAVALADGDSRVRVLREKVPGVAAARRAGFDAASESVIAGIDADTIVEDGWAQAIDGFFARHPATAAVTAPMVMRDLPLQRVYRRAQQRFVQRAVDADAAGATVGIAALSGANMAIRARAWKLVRDHVSLRRDVFDDLDLSLCLTEAGLSIAVAPGMQATVSGRRTLTSVAEHLRYAACVPRTYRMHHRSAAAILNTAYIPVGALRHALFLPLNRSWDPDARRVDLTRLGARQQYRAAPTKATLPSMEQTIND